MIRATAPHRLLQGFPEKSRIQHSSVLHRQSSQRAFENAFKGITTAEEARRSSIAKGESLIVPRRSFVCRSSAGSLSLPGKDDGSFSDPSERYSPVVAKIRGFLFYLWTFALALPLFVTMILQAPIVAVLDKNRRLAQHFVNDLWAKVSTRLFYTVRVEGRENLPAPDQPAVYIANHQSFLDIFSLFHLNRPFKFISKTSIFFIPIVGWSMFLTGHVKLNRMDKRSQLACLTKCRELLQQGASVLFFPEGTRTTDRRLQEFKKGAFTVAAKAKVPVVPITILGTGKKMPNKQENKMYPGKVEMIVHPLVQPSSASEMLEKARKAVQSRLVE